MSNFLAYLKKNWLNILLMIIGTAGGADAVAGMRSGKSATNVTVVPGLLAAAGAAGTLGVRWLNNRTVTTRTARKPISSDLMDRLENLCSLAGDPDVSPDHAAHLADMAGDLLLAENRRAKLESMQEKVIVKSPAKDKESPTLFEDALFRSLVKSILASPSPSPAGPSQVVPQPTTTTQEMAR